MFKLLKHLKKHIVPIILIIGLLVIQAASDLSLPEYTSRIVNGGIQQGGIENATPGIIKKRDLDDLLLFMDKGDKEAILKNYVLKSPKDIEDTDYAKYFNGFNKINDKVYILKDNDKKTIDNLNKIFAKPMIIAESINDKEMGRKIREELNKNLPPKMRLSESTNLLEFLKSMPEDKRSSIVEGFTKKFDSMPEGIKLQAATSYVKNEYASLGMNTEKLQNRFVYFTGFKMILLALISMVATVSVGYIGARVAASLGRDLRRDVFTKVVGFSNSEMDKFSTASLITRSTNDIQQIQMLMVMLLRVVFYAPILGIGGVIKVMNTENSMSWIIAVAVMAILTLVTVLFALAMPKFKSLQKLVDKVNLVTREILTGMMVIRAFNAGAHEEKRFDEANKNLTRTNLFVNRAMVVMMPLMMLIMNGITILILWSGAHKIDSGLMQVGDMMAFIQYTMQIIMSFLMISMVSIMIPRATVAAARVDEVLSTDFSIKESESPVSIKDDEVHKLEFNNVYFRYPHAEDDVLKNINFTANIGETVAFIGSTGCGKSTLINLIPRFYDVTKGEILINGINIKDIPQIELRDRIGYVPQKGVLFSGTINSNLKYGNKESTEEDIMRAAKISQSIDFINDKEDGFDAPISQGGGNVSGGQKQRLSIGRAIAKNPDVYIFDDSFSALDFKTDVALRKALSLEVKSSIVLIVAQRISTILHADKIIVLDNGEIKGIGTHKELLKECEVYKQIALSQLSKEELEDE